MEQPTSPRAASLRSMLLQSADGDRAMEISNQVVDQVNAILNDADVQIATSLVARALIARGIVSVAAAWWHDVSRQPEPVTFEAIVSILLDLPPEFDPVCFIDPAIAGRADPL